MWATDEVPGISRILGAAQQPGSATCIGVAPSRAATSDKEDDCSGVKPPSGKNGTLGGAVAGKVVNQGAVLACARL